MNVINDLLFNFTNPLVNSRSHNIAEIALPQCEQVLAPTFEVMALLVPNR